MNLEVKSLGTHAIAIILRFDKLNAENASDLKEVFNTQFNNSINNIILDLSAVKYCDSSGLSAVLHGNRLCKDSNGKFYICGLQPLVLKMITISRLDSILNIYENQEAAISSI